MKDRVKKIERLGQGCHCDVYRARFLGREVCLRIIGPNYGNVSEVELRDYAREIFRYASGLREAGVTVPEVLDFEVLDTNGRAGLWLVSEMVTCQGRDLSDELKIKLMVNVLKKLFGYNGSRLFRVSADLNPDNVFFLSDQAGYWDFTPPLLDGRLPFILKSEDRWDVKWKRFQFYDPLGVALSFYTKTALRFWHKRDFLLFQTREFLDGYPRLRREFEEVLDTSVAKDLGALGEGDQLKFRAKAVVLLDDLAKLREFFDITKSCVWPNVDRARRMLKE